MGGGSMRKFLLGFSAATRAKRLHPTLPIIFTIGFYLNLFLSSAFGHNQQSPNPLKIPPFSHAIPIVEQSTDYTCGPAVILSLRQFYFPNIKTAPTDQQLGKLIGTNSSVGTTPEQLLRGLKQFGLNGAILTPVDSEAFLQNLDSTKNYVFLIDDDGDAHWVLLAQLEKDSLILMDPYQNKGHYRSANLLEFRRNWQTVKFSSTKTYRNLVIRIDQKPK